MSRKVWPGTRQRVYERDAMTCRYCGAICILTSERIGRSMALVATVDHDVPRVRGGGSSFDNLVTCCFTCNTQKHRRTGDEYRVWLTERAQP